MPKQVKKSRIVDYYPRSKKRITKDQQALKCANVQSRELTEEEVRKYIPLLSLKPSLWNTSISSISSQHFTVLPRFHTLYYFI
jgi:hypothetical protein